MIDGLNELAKTVHELTRSKGFWDKPRDPLSVFMLIVSEVAEAAEDHRDGLDLNEIRYKTSGKPTGIPSEMADIIIRVLDACAAWNIDIEKAIQEKFEYNKSRPALHGRAY